MTDYKSDGQSPRTVADFRRTPAVVYVDASSTEEVAGAAHDRKFVGLYQRFLTGEIPIGYTRVSTSKVRANPGPIGLGPEGENQIARLSEMIRAGSRFTVCLYAADDASGEWICSDDLTTLAAYCRLGIAKVPAAVLNPDERLLEETSMNIRSRDGVSFFENHFRPPDTRLPVLKGDWQANAWQECTEALTAMVESSRSRLSKFHLDCPQQLHYHHTLASVLARAGRILSAIARLFEEGLAEQAIPLARSVYELALSTHLDWINPDRFGKFLVRQAELSNADLDGLWSEMEQKADSEHRERVRLMVESDKEMHRLASTPWRRAAISPFADFHRDSYRTFSAFAHQDFTSAAMFSDALYADLPASQLSVDDEHDMTPFLLAWLDLSICGICTWVNADTGER